MEINSDSATKCALIFITNFFLLLYLSIIVFCEVTEVLDDGVSGSGRCPGDSDGEI